MDLVFPLLTTSADLAIAIFLAFLPCRVDGCNCTFVPCFCVMTRLLALQHILIHSDQRFISNKP